MPKFLSVFLPASTKQLSAVEEKRASPNWHKRHPKDLLVGIAGITFCGTIGLWQSHGNPMTGAWKLGKSIDEQIQEADSALVNAIAQNGPDHAVVAERLLAYAALLRRSKTRLLDAVNMEARASVILSSEPPISRSADSMMLSPPQAEESTKTKADEPREETKQRSRPKLHFTRKKLTVLLVALIAIAMIPIAIQLCPTIFKKGTATISGAAWVNLRNGDSNIERGLEIWLCNQNAREKYQHKKRLRILDYLGDDIKDDVVSETRTDIDGKFSFTGIPPGSYFLYAQYDTSYSTATWFVPVELSGQDIKIDLSNNNFENVRSYR